MVFDLITLRRRWALLLAAACCLPVANLSPAMAQETDTAAEEATEDEKPDPFAVPEEASIQELFAFINKAKRSARNRADALKAAMAASKAADQIRKAEGVTLAQEKRAIQEQMGALQFASSMDKDAKASFDKLMEELESDERPLIRRIPALQAFARKAARARVASKDEQAALIADWKELVGDALDSECVNAGRSLASSIGRTDNTELAASFYEEIAAMMSKDETLKKGAEGMLASARRLRLPGNFMELTGTTTTGETFDWESYRGKVVLVDFWASWCGPCMGELPNMKKNLAGYQSKGFEIVGINMDSTLANCEKCVADKELTWQNIFSKEPGEQGWNAPLARYYGISGIPTAILVNQKGEVVSLNARGKELDKLLLEMLGDPVAPEETEEAEETEDK